jgi:thiol-disulfide isomerase/thioredoxin
LFTSGYDQDSTDTNESKYFYDHAVMNKTYVIYLIPYLGILIGLGFAASQEDDFRTWKDATGKYQVDAVFVSQSDTLVILRNRDGQEIKVAKDKLSAKDLSYLNAITNEATPDQSANMDDTSSDTALESDSPVPNTDQQAIKKLAETFFADLRTKERSEAKAILTQKAQVLVDEGRSPLQHLPSPDNGSRAIRVGKPSIRPESASVIVSVQVGKRFQKTMLVFKRADQDWRLYSISASQGDLEVTVDFESPYQPGDPRKNDNTSGFGETIEITGITLDGRKVSLSDYKGKVVLVDFWATWCGPCMKEMPNVYENYVKYHSSGFEVLAISLDRDMADLQKFMLEKNPPWVVLADEHPSNPPSMASKYGVRAIPTMLLIGRDGRVLDANCRGERLAVKLAEIFGR